MGQEGGGWGLERGKHMNRGIVQPDKWKRITVVTETVWQKNKYETQT